MDYQNIFNRDFFPTPRDVRAFGRTELTNIGYAVKIGKYKIF